MLGTNTIYGGVRPSFWPWNTFLFWYAICFFILFFPFLVCNLYYAYHDNTCVDIKPVPNTDINMSLAQWLQVDAYILLGFIVFFLLIGITAWAAPEMGCVYGLWEILHSFYALWRMVWLIIGAIIFWKGVNNGICAGRVRGYMWAMLIIGFVFLFVQLFFAFGYPRPIPYPVGAPVVAPISTGVITPSPMYRPASAIIV